MDPVIIWVGLKQCSDHTEELFLVKKAIADPPVVLATEKPTDLSTNISQINEKTDLNLHEQRCMQLFYL